MADAAVPQSPRLASELDGLLAATERAPGGTWAQAAARVLRRDVKDALWQHVMHLDSLMERLTTERHSLLMVEVL